MKIEDLYDADGKAYPFLTGADDSRKNIQRSIICSFIFLIIFECLCINLFRIDIYEQHFICNDSVCKIINLNQINPKLRTVSINRNDINYSMVQHVIYDPSYPINATNKNSMFLEDTPVIYRHLYRGGRIYHKYYIKIFLKKEYLAVNKDMTKLENHTLKCILGPMNSEKYAKEISEKINNTIHTNENINIKIKNGKILSNR